MNHLLEHAAKEFLAERHRLMGYILSAVRDPHTAEDIFQEVWVRLSAEIQREGEVSQQTAWCRGVARNLLLHHWRTEQRSKADLFGDLDDVLLELDTALAEDSLHVAEANDRHIALAECLVRLPAPAQELLKLRYEFGFSIDEISTRVSKSVAAITKTLSRLRELLCQCVERRLNPQE
jgi:RNA polymerase sigma-70 factor, ECF subfamily